MLARAISKCIVVTDAAECFAVAVEPPTAGFPTRRFDDLEGAFAFANQICSRRGWTVFDMTKMDSPKATVDLPPSKRPVKGVMSNEARAKISATLKARFAQRRSSA